VIACIDHGGVAVGVLCDQHRTPKSDLLVSDLLSQRIEVPARRLEILIAGNEDKRLLFTHESLRFASGRPEG